MELVSSNHFILGTVSDFWATVYKKRKIALRPIRDNFDAAAEINQFPYQEHYVARNSQDDEVRKVFRDFVDYVVEVRYLPNTHSLTIRNNIRFFRRMKKATICT